ncbi:MAG TPA: HD domain-containing phosphohydrolase [Blastocatellia bacterium]
MGTATGKPREQITTRLAQYIDNFEKYSRPHSRLIADLSAQLANRIGVVTSDINAIAEAALLHDIGLYQMAPAYLAGTGPLSLEERIDLWRHPIIGEQEMAKRSASRHSQLLVRWHHEWWNGTGYPDRLSGEDIPIGARIIRVVELYSALISDRPYRPAMSQAQAWETLRSSAGIECDPHVIRVLLGLLEELRPAETATSIPAQDEPLRVFPAGLETAVDSRQTVTEIGTPRVAISEPGSQQLANTDATNQSAPTLVEQEGSGQEVPVAGPEEGQAARHSPETESPVNLGLETREDQAVTQGTRLVVQDPRDTVPPANAGLQAATTAEDHARVQDAPAIAHDGPDAGLPAIAAPQSPESQSLEPQSPAPQSPELQSPESRSPESQSPVPSRSAEETTTVMSGLDENGQHGGAETAAEKTTNGWASPLIFRHPSGEGRPAITARAEAQEELVTQVWGWWRAHSSNSPSLLGFEASVLRNTDFRSIAVALSGWGHLAWYLKAWGKHVLCNDPRAWAVAASRAHMDDTLPPTNGEISDVMQDIYVPRTRLANPALRKWFGETDCWWMDNLRNNLEQAPASLRDRFLLLGLQTGDYARSFGNDTCDFKRPLTTAFRELAAAMPGSFPGHPANRNFSLPVERFIASVRADLLLLNLPAHSQSDPTGVFGWREVWVNGGVDQNSDTYGDDILSLSERAQSRQTYLGMLDRLFEAARPIRKWAIECRDTGLVSGSDIAEAVKRHRPVRAIYTKDLTEVAGGLRHHIITADLE